MTKGFIKIKHDPPRSWYMCINCGYTLPATSEPGTCPICNNEQKPPEIAQQLINAHRAPF